MKLRNRISRWLVRHAPAIRRIVPRKSDKRVRIDHIVILDGTNSSLKKGEESNAGQLYNLLRETAPAVDLNLHYEEGIIWDSWAMTARIITGRGINEHIKNAYGAIASRYQPGDRIFLFGFSRGAYAVRSLAGVIGRVGLLTNTHATERNIHQVFRHYEYAPAKSVAEEFTNSYCHTGVEVEMIGVWDTVKTLGLRLPFLTHLAEARYQFHDDALGDHVRNGFQALALDETRVAFAALPWKTPKEFDGKIEQVWFRGVHGDIGGHLSGSYASRPLANIPFVWLVSKAEQCGITLPTDWRSRFMQDATAPSIGKYKGWARFFLARKRRVVGQDRSEFLHPSVIEIEKAGGRKAPDLPVMPDQG